MDSTRGQSLAESRKKVDFTLSETSYPMGEGGAEVENKAKTPLIEPKQQQAGDNSQPNTAIIPSPQASLFKVENTAPKSGNPNFEVEYQDGGDYLCSIEIGNLPNGQELNEVIKVSPTIGDDVLDALMSINPSLQYAKAVRDKKTYQTQKSNCLSKGYDTESVKRATALDEKIANCDAIIERFKQQGQSLTVEQANRIWNETFEPSKHAPTKKGGNDARRV